jgi:hypothetical protein
VVAAGLVAHVGFGFLAVDAFLEGSNLERHPSDRLVQLVGAYTVALDAGELDVVDLPEFVTVVEDSGHDFGMEQSGADMVPATWNTVVVASLVP